MKHRFLPIVRIVFIIIILFTSTAALPYEAVPDTNMDILLQELGGHECFDGSAFTCVTIEVPL
ncbi:MAG: hypothetical protein HGA30_03370, partial [Anaerolineales bacterium]|nr:hypothetical protein [Anaerolineales bacterium]